MVLLLSIALAVNKVQPPFDALATSFQNPPASSRPHTWWHWMDGNITKAGISADLEAMKQAGIGGAHIFDVGQGVPSGPIDYNTPEWRELMVHAIREAKRLSLEMTMHNCAGWSSSGAPWVKPEDAMKKVVFASSEVSFPGKVSIPVPQIVGGYYRDILILAFPSIEKPNPNSLNELTGLGANPGQISKLGWPKIESKRTMIIGPDKIGADGTIDVQYPDGKWTILRIGVTLTGSKNVASRDSGRGLEVDKLSDESLDRFLDGGMNPLLNLVGNASALTTVLVDSYETGYNNWTPKLLDEFQARRGYDPRPFLPALAGYLIDDEKNTLGFLFDYRKTIAELWAQNYSGHFAERLKERNLGLAIEPYGNGNFDPFSFAKPASLIMGEYWVGDAQINPSVKHASSVAHVYGHNVVGAEALTATPDQAGWRNQPRQWKPFADRAMTLGINRIIYHRFAHQPWINGVLPGMTMGPWGSHVDRGNTIWPYMPSWNEYVSRCQFILQSGTFVGDVLLFPGEDVPQSYAGEGQDLPQVPQGYDFDFCGVDPLMSLMVRNGRLALPNGATYAVLALPNTDLMTLPLARKIKELVQLGATVIGPRPARTPSLSEQSLSTELNEIAVSVWGTEPTKEGSHKFGKGQVYWSQPIGTVLSNLGVKPDFWTDAKDVRAIHRRIGEREAYFVASAQPYPKTAVCRFRTNGKPVAVQLWHPESGRIENAPIWKAISNQSSGIIEIPIQFDGDGSVFVMLSPVVKVEPHLTEVRATVAVAKAKVLPRLRIIKAEYGDTASGKVKDVTKIVSDAASPHSIRINASNGDMGGDPAVNIVKNLVVTYQLGEATTTATIRENGTFAIGNLPDAGTPPVFESGTKQILAWQKGEYYLTWSNGRKSTLKVHDLPEPVEVKGPWQLKFPGGWGAPPIISLKSLSSWTDNTDFNIKHFSGTVAYSKSLPISAAQIAKGKRLILDLGDVRELCRVRLNGKSVATLWKAPFRIDVTKFVHAGTNRLEIEVTNLWVNRLIGDEQFPDDMGWDGSRLSGWPTWFVNQTARPEPRRLTFTTWRHNYKDTPLLPSGLLGPVLLRMVRDIPIRP